MQGEEIKDLKAHIGLLHRGTEKLIEYKTAQQALPYFDRLDYVSTLAMEHCFCLAVERLTSTTLNYRTKSIRMLFLEITRILNHLLAISCFALDTGALTPFLFAFEEREKLMEFYERVSGARFHSAFFRPGGISADLPNDLLNSIFNWSKTFSSRIDEIEELLTNSSILKQRTVDIGVLSAKDALSLGVSGVLLRSTGICYDIRKVQPYELYDHVTFDVPVTYNGDCYDRFLLRIEELKQSIRIVKQAINMISNSAVAEAQEDNTLTGYKTSEFKTSMESLIKHFKCNSSGFAISTGETYCATESPKGEFGTLLASNGTNRPYRVKIKSPDFASMQALNVIAKNHYLADLVAIIGSIDVVFGSVDR
jgi:NADH:ubiquinone oxidoreductase subunit D